MMCIIFVCMCIIYSSIYCDVYVWWLTIWIWFQQLLWCSSTSGVWPYGYGSSIVMSFYLWWLTIWIWFQQLSWCSSTSGGWPYWYGSSIYCDVRLRLKFCGVVYVWRLTVWIWLQHFMMSFYVWRLAVRVWFQHLLWCPSTSGGWPYGYGSNIHCDVRLRLVSDNMDMAPEIIVVSSTCGGWPCGYGSSIYHNVHLHVEAGRKGMVPALFMMSVYICIILAAT